MIPHCVSSRWYSPIFRSEIPGEKSSKKRHRSRNTVSFTVLRIYAITSLVAYTWGNPSTSRIIWNGTISNPDSRRIHPVKRSFSLYGKRISGNDGYDFPHAVTWENPVPKRSVPSGERSMINGSDIVEAVRIDILKASSFPWGKKVDFIDSTSLRSPPSITRGTGARDCRAGEFLLWGDGCGRGEEAADEVRTGRGERTRIVDEMTFSRTSSRGRGAHQNIISSVSPKISHINIDKKDIKNAK